MLEVRTAESGLIGHMPVGTLPAPGRFQITALKPDKLAVIDEDAPGQDIAFMSDHFDAMEFRVVERYHNRVETKERLTWPCILVTSSVEILWLSRHGMEWLQPPSYARSSPMEISKHKDYPDRGSQSA